MLDQQKVGAISLNTFKNVLDKLRKQRWASSRYVLGLSDGSVLAVRPHKVSYKVRR